jgi:mono/diheme cytochrome c family protein
MVHQRAGITVPPSPIATGPAYYSPAPSCDVGMTPAQITVLRPDAAPVSTPWVSRVVLPIDFAITRVDATASVLSAGAEPRAFTPYVRIGITGIGSSPCGGTPMPVAFPGMPVAIAHSARWGDILQLREPAALRVTLARDTIPLSTESLGDRGHAMFHASTSQFVACASCHPEGGDDGHTWRLTGQGLRRTPDLRGGVLSTAPFHWDGTLSSMGALVDEVLVRRMGGAMPDAAGVTALGSWLDAVPSTPRSTPVDGDAVARGRAVFERPDTLCASCHSGPRMTNNATVDVGTGAAFQVPTLVGLGGRAPYLHDGCAATVRDRFGRCGGGEQHGHTKQLSDAELDELVAYLESL